MIQSSMKPAIVIFDYVLEEVANELNTYLADKPVSLVTRTDLVVKTLDNSLSLIIRIF